MILNSSQVIANIGINDGKRFPDSKDARSVNKLLSPLIKPKFQFKSSSKIFTIGSCFARNIEEVLVTLGAEVPTSKFTAPKSEFPHRANGLLNEYNPGTISQRILSAANNQPPSNTSLVPIQNMQVDLLLPGVSPVSPERAQERRKEIYQVYTELIKSDVLIITLGMVEAWFDNINKTYLNRMPPLPSLRAEPERFKLHKMNVDDSLSVLKPAMEKIIASGMKKIVLTVSPVPLQTTFTADDAVVANGYSKAVLRVCAQELSEIFSEVDYFASYEMVTHGGLSVYGQDHVHVKPEAVEVVTRTMLDAFLQK